MRITTRRTRNLLTFSLIAGVVLISAFQTFELPNVGSAVPTSTFTNFESPHVHPLDMTPNGQLLLAVNTANNTLEVFQLGGPMMLNVASIPVGLDPVTVRVRSNTEAWVVNQVSDEISVVDLTQNLVVRSIATEDEPADVVFAGSPQKAFVSCAGRESVQVFDLVSYTLSSEVLLKGEQPRALAVSPSGTTVYCAFFESGNATTVLNGNNFFNFQHGTFGNGNPKRGVCSPQGGCTFIPNDVTNPAGPYGGAVDPVAGIIPNAGTGFNPPFNTSNPPTPETKSIIVRKNAAGQWFDDNGGNWTNMVSGSAANKARMTGWDMPDRDVAVIDANAPSTAGTTYQTRLGNILMAMAVQPGTGQVTVVGTDATNEIRFEPVLNGKFLRVNLSRFTTVGGANTITDLNPHINYANSALPIAQRIKSIGDPRAIVWKADGSKAYIAGMGSNNLIAIDGAGTRLGSGPIPVGEGPTGIVIDGVRNKLYVLNKFEGSVSTVDMVTDQEEARANFFDPTPMVIKAGRKHLYNTHLGSGNGHISCGSCHVDGRWDRLGWDLGDPSGAMNTVSGKSFHPLKGVKTTQFLIDIINRGRGNLHWRGDKEGFEDFAGAFTHLQGLSAPKPLDEMQEFEDFLAATWYVPNPYRVYKPDSQSSTSRLNPNRVRGTGTTFQSIPPAVNLFVAVNQNCAHCHNAQTGRGELMGNGNVAGTGPGTHVDFTFNRNMSSDLRSSYRKNGFFYNTTECNSGFGLMSEGVMETWFNTSGVGGGGEANGYFGDYEPEILSWSGGIDAQNCAACFTFPLASSVVQDAAPGVGLRQTFNGASIGSVTQLNVMKDLVDTRSAEYGMIVKGKYGGEMRGFYYMGSNLYQSDISGQTVTHTQLLTSAQGSGGPLSWTLVHPSTRVRAGVDADNDAILDHDDLQAKVNVRANMEGAYVGTAMRSTLRDNSLLPATDPYGQGAQVDPDVLQYQGLAAPVDWALVELRNNATPTLVEASRAVLVQRSGNLMMPAGEQTITFPTVPAGNYHVVVRHRNHLGVMTFQPAALGSPGALVDFTKPATATWGTDAQKNVAGVMVMWAGDVSGNGIIKYAGGGNDRDPILVRIGGTVPTTTVPGYHPEDVNLDGVVKYAGSSNDRDPILVNIGGSVPTAVKTQQVP
ncbi:MAG: beta-propeller fold lactonase family protein [Flavobacteriales bacterium]|nr:beta-propeller fold lactonase family protein [Flavobacteriales bacterium]MBP6697257.1 beta-propeller fold lactonase family protein [Flavobacteriales bacterium]